MSLTQIHGLLSRAILLYTLIIAGFAGLYLLRRREIGGDFWGAVILGEGLIVVQGILGVIMLIVGLAPARLIHILYGVVAVITWPAVFAFTRGGTSRRETLYWLLLSVFLFGISLRAMTTAVAH
jgi:heme A synthase